MKTLLVVGVLVAGMSGQALSMGHPHNVFAARKQMRAKAATSVVKPKVATDSCWQTITGVDKAAFSKRLLAALSRVRPTQSF